MKSATSSFDGTMKMLPFFVGLFSATVHVGAFPQIPTCNDPDFRCKKACKSGKGTNKSRRLKSSKKAKKGGTVKSCDWIDGLPMDAKEGICEKKQGGKEISHFCPETCLDTLCALDPGESPTTSPFVDGVCGLSAVPVTDPCPSKDDIEGTQSGENCTAPIRKECVYNTIGGAPYDETALLYKCFGNGWFFRSAFECPPTQEEYKALYFQNNTLDVSSTFRTKWTCSYPQNITNKIPYIESITTYTWNRASGAIEWKAVNETRFNCPNEEGEIEMLIEENENEICNESLNFWTCPYNDEYGKSGCQKTYRCGFDSTFTTTDFVCPSTKDELESLLEDNENELCTDDFNWSCGYGDGSLRCLGGKLDRIFEGILFDPDPPDQISNPSSCPLSAPPIGGLCSVPEGIECVYSSISNQIEGSSVYWCCCDQPEPEPPEPVPPEPVPLEPEPILRFWSVNLTQSKVICPKTRTEMEAIEDVFHNCFLNGPCDEWECQYGFFESTVSFGCNDEKGCYAPDEFSSQC